MGYSSVIYYSIRTLDMIFLTDERLQNMCLLELFCLYLFNHVHVHRFGPVYIQQPPEVVKLCVLRYVIWHQTLLVSS